jgi:hypothetical protein
MWYMGSEVYSWRVSSELKSDLKREARLRKTSVSAVLHAATQDWLKRHAAGAGGDEEQQRLHRAVAACTGTIAGHNPRRAGNARRAIRERLRRHYAR